MTKEVSPALPQMTAIAPTICETMGVSSRDCHGAAPLPGILDAARRLEGPVERYLIVAGDAIGVEQLTRYPDVAETLSQAAPEAVTLRAMSPSVTPAASSALSISLPAVAPAASLSVARVWIAGKSAGEST